MYYAGTSCSLFGDARNEVLPWIVRGYFCICKLDIWRMLNTFHGYVSTCWVSRPASISTCRLDWFVGVGCFECRSTICRLQLMQKCWCSSTVEFVRHEMHYLRPSQELLNLSFAFICFRYTYINYKYHQISTNQLCHSLSVLFVRVPCVDCLASRLLSILPHATLGCPPVSKCGVSLVLSYGQVAALRWSCKWLGLKSCEPGDDWCHLTWTCSKNKMDIRGHCLGIFNSLSCQQMKSTAFLGEVPSAATVPMQQRCRTKTLETHRFWHKKPLGGPFP